MRNLLKNYFAHTSVPWVLLILNGFAAVGYFGVIALFMPAGNPLLFALLILGEIFHVWQVLSYVLTIWSTETMPELFRIDNQPVDVFITVAGEPAEIVRETAIAAKAMRYPDFRVFLLNDGLVAKKENWKEIETLAKELGIGCITRTVPGGAKAGNINNALRQTKSPFVVVFDADHVPHTNFLEKTMGYFADEKIAFVQSPQYYKNAEATYVAGAAWEQQELFFGPIMKGKNKYAAAFMCGTNMVIRRTAIDQVGGMCEFNIAEDFLTSLFIHEKGWKSVYVSEVLAEGLAPEDFLSYYKQQFRWARGSLEVIFRYNPLFRKGLAPGQAFQYLASASYYLSGLVVILDALLPLVYFYTGAVPLVTSTMVLAAVFLPYVFITIYNLQVSSNFTYTFRSLSFSVSSAIIQVSALWAVLTKKKSGFAVTSKTQVVGNFVRLVIPQITYVSLTVIGITYALIREGLTPSVVTNAAWAIFTSVLCVPMIMAALPQRQAKPVELAVPEPLPTTL